MHGVSTRKGDDLVQALGLQAGISKSEVSRIGSVRTQGSRPKRRPIRPSQRLLADSKWSSFPSRLGSKSGSNPEF